VITRGSPDDAYFQHHRHNTKNTQLLSSNSAGTPWSTTSSSFPDQKKGTQIRKQKQIYYVKKQRETRVPLLTTFLSITSLLLHGSQRPSLIPSSRAAFEAREEACSNSTLSR
jgi:hypothetical protein